MKQTAIIAFAIGVALGGCAERQVSIDDDEPVVMPACMILPARGYWNDGSTWTITNEEDVTGSVCMCMTKDELINQVYVDELNQRGLAECNRMAKLHHDFDWTTCQEGYEQGEWIGLVAFAFGDWEWANHEGLTCDEDESGCSVGGDRSPGPGWGLLLAAALFGLRRRHSAHQARRGPSRRSSSLRRS